MRSKWFADMCNYALMTSYRTGKDQWTYRSIKISKQAAYMCKSIFTQLNDTPLLFGRPYIIAKSGPAIYLQTHEPSDDLPGHT